MSIESENTANEPSEQSVVHTPGPWEAYYVQSAGWSVRMAQPREGFDRPDPICSMAWWQFDKPGIIDNGISEANAKLIAAAPDMLAAIQGALRIADLWVPSDAPKEHFEESRALYLMLRSFEAIARKVV